MKASIGCLGPKRSNTDLVTEKWLEELHLAFPLTIKHFPTNQQVIDAAGMGDVSTAVVPIESSVAGGVPETLGALIRKNGLLQIIDVLVARICHCFVAFETFPLTEATITYSHPHALAQCSGWRAKNVPQAEQEEVHSTADAIRLVSENKKRGEAAIGTAKAAEEYGCVILARNIQDNPYARTRFLVISNFPDFLSRGADNCKTAMTFRLKNEHSALYAFLGPFARREINITYPPTFYPSGDKEAPADLKEMPVYHFYAEAKGHISEPILKEALKEVEKLNIVENFHVLGSYPTTELEI